MQETRRLYYEDCHLAEFSARVTGCEQQENGWAVTLDATAFYPEGGGQACDRGTLGGVRVLEVREQGEKIIHLCDGPLGAGSHVTGKIDWDRRFDLMQQHTGEHIVSGLIHKTFGYHNTGFHVGAEMMEVDFSGPIAPEDLAKIEAQANEAIWKNLAVKCWVPSPEELSRVTYRTKRALPWPVRIVQIPGYDTCACCGVHTGFTGEVGLIKILSAVKFRGGIRMEMACGRRAYRYVAAAFEQNRLVSQMFSAKMLETGEAARRMNEALAAEKFRCEGLRRQLLEGAAGRFSGAENAACFDETLSGGDLRYLAEKMAEVCSGTVAVLGGNDEKGWNFCLASRDKDLCLFGRDMTKALNGRGGGKPHFQQGSLKASRAEIEAYLKIHIGPNLALSR